MMKLVISTDNEDTMSLCDFYWAIDDDGNFIYTVKELSNKFNITAQKINIIVKTYCIAYSSDIFCNLCSAPYEYIVRSDYSRLSLITLWTCDSCKNYLKYTEEKNIQQILQEELAKKCVNDPLTIEKIDLRMSILLLSLFRFGADEDLMHINEYTHIQHERFCPDPEHDGYFINELYERGYIQISPLSNPGYITLSEGGKSLSFQSTRVKWVLPLTENVTLKDFIEQLEKKITSTQYLKNLCDEVGNLCMEISLLECLAYLKYVMNEHQLPFNPGDKTRMILSKALEKYSVAQIYSFIWRATKDSAAFFMRTNGIQRRHAANTVVGNIERIVERSNNQDWEVSAFKRNYEMPQSITSCVLFNMLLRTDDGGFHLPLSQIIESFLENVSLSD